MRENKGISTFVRLYFFKSLSHFISRAKRAFIFILGSVLLSCSPCLATFSYDPITEPITSATFSADFAALVAHRSVFGHEVNFARLIDTSGSLGVYDLSDDLFGTAAYPDIPQLDMGDIETGIVSANIDSSFFPALAGGSINLFFCFTDTDDAMFAIDFISLTIETDTTTVESFYGWPIGNENNGFGIGLADGADLPSPLPTSIPIDATGTGFDECISSKTTPEPTTLVLFAFGTLALLRHRQRSVTPKSTPKTTTRVSRQALARPLSLIIPILLTITFIQSVSMAGARKWVGSAGGYWFTPENWSPAIVPSSSDDVTIPGNQGHVVRVNGQRITVNSLTIEDSTSGSGDTVLIGGNEKGGLIITTTGDMTVGKNGVVSAMVGTFDAAGGLLQVNCKGDLTVAGSIVGGRISDNSQHPKTPPETNIKAKNLTVKDAAKIVGATGQHSDGKRAPGNGGNLNITVKDWMSMEGDSYVIKGGEPGDPEGTGKEGKKGDRTTTVGGRKTVSGPTNEGSDVVTRISPGGEIQIAGVSENTIQATENVFLVADDPGGVIDFTGNPAGIAVIRAGTAINVYASQVLLDPGVTLTDITDPPATELDETPFEDPDQLHIIGPVPTEIPVGRLAPIQASVQNGFVGIPGEEVVFKKLTGDFNFHTAFLSPDGTEATFTTDADGNTEVWIDANDVGEALIEVTVMGQGLSLSAYSFFEIVPCPLVANLDDDCDVDFIDFAILGDQWLQAPGVPSADIAPLPNGDGMVNGLDLKELVDSWLEGK